jgi:hypothetical protein
MRFKEYLRICETDDESPAAIYARMRQGVFGNATDRPAEQPGQPPAPAPTGGKPDIQIPPLIMNAIASGFETGSGVSDSVVRFLKLDGENYSLVADSSQFTSGFAYPFVKEKRAGRHTGKIMYVRGFPVSRFMDKLRDLIAERQQKRRI